MTRINPVYFVRIVQGTRPLGAIILVKFLFLKFWGRKPTPVNRSSTLIGLDRCNVSPLRGEKPQNRPVNNNNTGRAALRADPAGNYN